MDSKIKDIVSKNLKQARETKQNIYSRYETGKLELDYCKIEFLCRLFDITPNDLFGF